jgi:hypothetical protein
MCRSRSRWYWGRWENAFVLEAYDGVVEALSRRRELDAQVTEPLVRYLVRLLPRVHLVGAPAMRRGKRTQW